MIFQHSMTVYDIDWTLLKSQSDYESYFWNFLEWLYLNGRHTRLSVLRCYWLMSCLVACLPKIIWEHVSVNADKLILIEFYGIVTERGQTLMSSGAHGQRFISSLAKYCKNVSCVKNDSITSQFCICRDLCKSVTLSDLRNQISRKHIFWTTSVMSS